MAKTTSASVTIATLERYNQINQLNEALSAMTAERDAARAHEQYLATEMTMYLASTKRISQQCDERDTEIAQLRTAVFKLTGEVVGARARERAARDHETDMAYLVAEQSKAIDDQDRQPAQQTIRELAARIHYLSDEICQLQVSHRLTAAALAQVRRALDVLLTTDPSLQDAWDGACMQAARTQEIPDHARTQPEP